MCLCLLRLVFYVFACLLECVHAPVFVCVSVVFSCLFGVCCFITFFMVTGCCLYVLMSARLVFCVFACLLEC